ncbi:hypothetical protein UlMin_027082 [Ulmus minor]
MLGIKPRMVASANASDPRSLKDTTESRHGQQRCSPWCNPNLCYFIFSSIPISIVVAKASKDPKTNEISSTLSIVSNTLGHPISTTRECILIEVGYDPSFMWELSLQEIPKQTTLEACEDPFFSFGSGNKEDIEKFSKRTVKVTKQHNEDCQKNLRLMGALVIEYVVVSEDMDSLTFGDPRFLRHLMDPSSRKVPIMEFEVAKLNLTIDQFIDLCIVSGCDYCDSIRGIGGQTALKLIHQHGSIENILESINKERCIEMNLVLNWEKCHFMINRGIFLGYVISHKGIEIDKSKIDLAFEKLREILTTALVIQPPDWSCPFKLKLYFDPFVNENVELQCGHCQISIGGGSIVKL